MNRRNLFLSAMLVVLLAFTGSVAQAQTVIRLLCIGNSFSEDAVEQNLYELAHEAGYELIIGNAYRGGQGLESHWNVVSKHQADFEYRKVVGGKKTNRTKVVLDDIVRDEPWDIITFQQVSQDAGLYATYQPYLQQLIDYVKRLTTAKHVTYGFHQTWAYAKGADHWGFAKYDRDQMKMYRGIIDASQRVLHDHKDLSFLVPCGTAIQNARTTALGDHMNRDGYHLDYHLGRYTAACTWLEVITGVAATDVSWHPSTINDDAALVARRAAHAAVQQPYAVMPQPSGLDTLRISMFGSSVANGTGATDMHGYAWQYNRQLQDRWRWQLSRYPFAISNISVGGNTTVHLLNRYHDLVYDLSRYVIFGLSLGNEGIHDTQDRQGVFNRWRDNMLKLISMARADGKVPVVMNNYTRADFTDSDYVYVRRLNLLIHQWDVPSVNTLGAIDDGHGRWTKDYQGDPYHPNDAGHEELMLAIPPSLFDALAQSKPLPVRDTTQHAVLSGSETFSFRGEGTVHPFAVTFTIDGNHAGRLFTLHSGNRQARIGINKKHQAYYVTMEGDSLVSTTRLSKAHHTITLSHYYASARTLFDVDGSMLQHGERLLPGLMTLGDETGSSKCSRQFGELMFWRSALNADEMAATRAGKLLKSSLELYLPLGEQQKASPVNRAQSLNNVRFTSGLSH